MSAEGSNPCKSRSSAPVAGAWGEPLIGLQQGGSVVELQRLLEEGPASYRKESTPPFSSSTPTSLAAAGLYGGVGLGMGFANKAVLQQWPYSNTLLMLQMATSILLVTFFSFTNLAHVRPIDMKGVRALFPLAFFYNANAAFALAAIQSLSIPVYHVMKRLTPISILLIKILMGDGVPPAQIIVSVLVVVGGCILSGLGDLSFDAMGYTMAVVSCLLQAMYLILVERSSLEKGYNSNELLLYSALMSLPFLLLLVICSGELGAAIDAAFILVGNVQSQSFLGLKFIHLLGSSLIMGSLLHYALFLCTITNSALGTTIVGTFRSILGTFLGFFLLGGVKITPMIVIGVSVNTAGGVWYTVAKYTHKHVKLDPSKRDELPL